MNKKNNNNDVTNNTPMVTIIMSAYNHEKYVGQAIESVLNQTYKNYKFIVADDCSTDRTRDVILRYENEIDEIHFFDMNSGSGRTGEFIDIANTKYVAIINSDDIWETDKLEKQINYLESHNECAVCFSGVKDIDDEGNELNVGLFTNENKSSGEWLRYFFDYGNCFANPSSVCRTAIRQKIREAMNAGIYKQLPDYFMWVSLLMTYEVHVIPERLISFRWHNCDNVSQPNPANNMRHIMDECSIWLEIFRKIEDSKFIEVFNEKFVDEKTNTPKEIACEKFLVLVSSDKVSIQEAGIRYYQMTMQDIDTYKVLEGKYGFTNKMFYELEKNIGIGGMLIQADDNIRRLQYELQNRK